MAIIAIGASEEWRIALTYTFKYGYSSDLRFYYSWTTNLLTCAMTNEDMGIWYRLCIKRVFQPNISKITILHTVAYESYHICYEMAKLPKMPPHAKLTALRFKGVI